MRRLGIAIAVEPPCAAGTSALFALGRVAFLLGVGLGHLAEIAPIEFSGGKSAIRAEFARSLASFVRALALEWMIPGPAIAEAQTVLESDFDSGQHSALIADLVEKIN